MKKKTQCVLFLLMLLSVVSMASAAEKRANQRRYDLSFSGTTAYCYAYCKSDLTTDKVVANVMLYQGSNVVASWSAQGTGSVTISESVPVKKGCEYTMSLTWSVAGQWQRSVFWRALFMPSSEDWRMPAALWSARRLVQDGI